MIRNRAPAANVAGDPAVRAIARRIATQLDDIGRTMAVRYRDEIVDYASLDDAILFEDVAAISVLNFEVLLATVESGDGMTPAALDEFRASGARRVHQGIPLESLLHAYRLWGQAVWETVLGAARVDRPDEREAALRMAGKIIDHLNVVSTVVAQAYLDEAQGVWSDREVIRRDVLEALLAGRPIPDHARGRAATLGLDVRENYQVVLVGRAGCSPEEARGPWSPAHGPRHAVELIRARLRPRSGSTLVGLRHDEIVALWPADSTGDPAQLRRQATALAADLGPGGYAVGIGGFHPGPSGTSASYAEAKEALEVALRAGKRGFAVAFDDILLEHIVRASPRAGRIVGDILSPVRDYDARRGTELIATLEAYMEAGFNLTRSAAALSVNPNTVVYRLRRIRELSGRDPGRPEDLLLLCLGLKAADTERTLSRSADRRPGVPSSRPRARYPDRAAEAAEAARDRPKSGENPAMGELNG